MIGCLRTRVRKQPIIVLYFEVETVLKFYNLEPRKDTKYCIAKHGPNTEPPQTTEVTKNMYQHQQNHRLRMDSSQSHRGAKLILPVPVKD